MCHADQALDMRFLSFWAVDAAMASAANMVIAGSDPSTIAAWLDTSIRTTFNSSSDFDAEYIAESYWSSLGLWFPDNPNDNGQGSTDDGAPALALGVGIGVGAVGVLGVMAAAAWLLVRRKKRVSLFGKTRPPQAGPNSTLLVSDIENSTGLWEGLPQVTCVCCFVAQFILHAHAHRPKAPDATCCF